MSLESMLTEDRRGAILRILHDQGEYSLNDGVLQDALERLGHNVPRDLIRDDLSWLKERQLVTIDAVSPNLWIAVIAGRGIDFQKGRIRGGIPGLKRHTGLSAMGRKSTITKWPPEIRKELERMLSDETLTQAQIVDHMRAIGVATSESAVQRYNAKFQELAKDVRLTREMAKVVGKELSDTDGDAGRLIVETLQGLLLKCRLQYMGDGQDKEIEPADMKALAQSAAALAQAMKANVDTEMRITDRVKKDIATRTETTLKENGISKATIETIKASILGIGRAS